jgi:hypothetical protein
LGRDETLRALTCRVVVGAAGSAVSKKEWEMTTLEDAATVNRPQGDKKPTTRQLHSTSGAGAGGSRPYRVRGGCADPVQAEDEAVDLGVLATVLRAFGFVPCRLEGSVRQDLSVEARSNYSLLELW